MALYELRTYTLRVGAMAEAVKLYQELGYPALQKGGQDKKLIGYFQSDTGTLQEIPNMIRPEPKREPVAERKYYEPPRGKGAKRRG